MVLQYGNMWHCASRLFLSTQNNLPVVWNEGCCKNITEVNPDQESVNAYANEIVSMYQEKMSCLGPSENISIEEFPAREIVTEVCPDPKLVDAIVKQVYEKMTEINANSSQ